MDYNTIIEWPWALAEAIADSIATAHENKLCTPETNCVVRIKVFSDYTRDCIIKRLGTPKKTKLNEASKTDSASHITEIEHPVKFTTLDGSKYAIKHIQVYTTDDGRPDGAYEIALFSNKNSLKGLQSTKIPIVIENLDTFKTLELP